jgi:predicted 3-demethylubiquinone-9 3-methyltransferase (glyoxalase superfamily)
MQKITPFLWYDDQAEEAARFYISIFENSRIDKITPYSEAGPGVPGSAMTVAFELDGVSMIALNGGPHYKFTEALSLSVACEDQAELDRIWDRLCEGGEAGPCGWLKDRYGVSWQVIPAQMPDLVGDRDPERVRRVMQAMFKMTKLNIAALEAARDG